MKLIAHRGLHQNGVAENSLASFQQAIANKDYDGFEFDIRTSKDGIFIIHHDLFIDGNLIRFLNYSELKEKYHLTSLEEVLKLKTDKIMLLEIKEANIDTDALNKLIRQYPHTNLYIDSFDNKIIERMMKYQNHAKYGVLNYILNSEQNYQKYDFIGLLSSIITDDLIAFFEKNKIEIFIYGILNKKQIGKYQNAFYIVD